LNTQRSILTGSFVARILNLGPTGLPLAIPDPAHDNLLPTDDSIWYQGAIGPSPALYTNGFSSDAELGPFARVCQASHILGRVINHRNSKKGTQTREYVMEEALQLSATHLFRQIDERLGNDSDKPIPAIDIAICICSRLALYHLYACNLPSMPVERLSQETTMQAACIEGIKQILSTRALTFTRHILHQVKQNPQISNPLVIQALYDAATECQWFVQEEDSVEAERTLQLLMEALALLAKRWGIAG